MRRQVLFADAVQLMTLHGSKGLEFPVVLIYGAGKGEIPPEAGSIHRIPKRREALLCGYDEGKG